MMREESEKDLINVILNDVKRTQSESHIFKYPIISESMIRILFVYSKRHPLGGGYT